MRLSSTSRFPRRPQFLSHSAVVRYFWWSLATLWWAFFIWVFWYFFVASAYGQEPPPVERYLDDNGNVSLRFQNPPEVDLSHVCVEVDDPGGQLPPVELGCIATAPSTETRIMIGGLAVGDIVHLYAYDIEGFKSIPSNPGSVIVPPSGADTTPPAPPTIGP